MKFMKRAFVEFFLTLYEMITSVRFYLPYDTLIWDYVAFKKNFISVKKLLDDTAVVTDVTCTRQSVITRVII